jgi:hypothetical protein
MGDYVALCPKCGEFRKKPGKCWQTGCPVPRSGFGTLMLWIAFGLVLALAGIGARDEKSESPSVGNAVDQGLEPTETTEAVEPTEAPQDQADEATGSPEPVEAPPVEAIEPSAVPENVEPDSPQTTDVSEVVI